MAGTDKRKQSLYFPDDMLSEISTEAIRLDRSLSWVMQRAWRIASADVARLPSAPGPRTARAPVPASSPEREPSAQVREFVNGKFERK
jgi:uncharacterized small protein (TIGR04563 family)